MNNLIISGTNLITGRRQVLSPGDILVNSAGGYFQITSGYYGTGLDGTLNLDGTNTYSGITKVGSVYSLNRDIFATTLQVQTGVTLITQGWRVFTQVSLTTISGGIIACLASSVLNGIDGTNSPTGPPGGTGGAKQSIGGTGATANGGFGGSSVAGQGGSIALFSLGGSGGNGGTGSGTAGGGGGTWIAATGATLQNLSDAISCSIPNSGTLKGITGGSGGGGGGGGAATGGGNFNTGGSGGGGGGVMMLASPTITNNGTIQAQGGNGGNGLVNGGGGGGGGGGVIVTITNSGTVFGNTPSVVGGSGGTGNVIGTAGNPGSYFSLIAY